MEENFAKRTAQHGSHVGLSDEDGLSGSSQEQLSHMLKHRDASPDLMMDQYDLDHSDPQVKRLLHLEKRGGGGNVPAGPNWHPNPYQTVQQDLSHLSLRTASEAGNRVAHRAINSMGNQDMAMALGNRRKLDKAQAASIDDEYMLGDESHIIGKKTKPTPRWQDAAMGLAFSQPEVRFPPGANPNAKRCKSNQNARLPARHRNQMAAEALDNSSALLKHPGNELLPQSDYHSAARVALQTQLRSRQLHARTTDRKSRALQGLAAPMGLELQPPISRGHNRTQTVQATKNQFHLLSHKPSLNVAALNASSLLQYGGGPNVNAVMLNQALGQAAIQKSLAFARNQADHIVAEAQSLKSRQISRGMVKINQRKFELQKLEKEREQLGRQNQIWQQIHREHHVTASTKRNARGSVASADAKIRGPGVNRTPGDSESELSGPQ